jgi:glycosyltransferase involved in cell wall biosynthesis
LIRVLSGHCQLTVVPNVAAQLNDARWRSECERWGARCCLFDQLHGRLSGTGLALCNGRFFPDRIAHRAKERGLRILWSGEMMWHHPGEVEAVREGVVDEVLYVSPLQRMALAAGHAGVPWTITGNYVDPAQFPFRRPVSGPFTIGRLSRPDPDKYPEDFPVFYEALGLDDCCYRVMAWDEALAAKYSWHRFGPGWERLGPAQEPAADFLSSLDLLVYPLGHRVVESWGRAVVEAMLTGCIPLVPAGHHFEQLIIDGETGFVCRDFLDYQEHAQALRANPRRRQDMARAAREHSVAAHCSIEAHRRMWLELFR